MSGAISLTPTKIKSFRNWLHEKWQGTDETAPLLDGGQQHHSKITAFRVVTTISAVFGALLVLTTSIFFWYHQRNTNTRPPPSSLTDAEKIFLDFPSNDSIREYLKTYTSEAHLAGSDNDKRQAEWTRDQLASFGLATEISTYWPLLNYPVSHRFGIITGPEHLRYEATLKEDPVDEDDTSRNPNAVPTFHGYSKNGTATGRVIYANYGRREDFQFLQDSGVQTNGTIALVRYGGSYRGLKVRAAELFGCIGVLIFSDPADDGPLNKTEGAYPEGPWRSQSSVQRGSVLFLSLVSGDPLTVGYPATENATRTDPNDSPGLASIPSLPLSYQDALPILKATQGRGVQGSGDWRGGLQGVDYFSGPTEGEAILVNHVDNKITPIWNVIARINGTEEPDKAIILGNHRDAWVYGAVDPSSGSATLLELARGFGTLLATGWRPRRTIILASWDAEEYGLVGSTEWVEDNKSWLTKEGAVYINVDMAVSGPHFDVQASPSLNQLIYTVASQIQDPSRPGLSVLDAWKSDTTTDVPPIGALGSGSDYVAFLDHLGITSLSMAFTGNYGVYHSNYDSFHWMEKFGDPHFLYHQTLCKIWGLLALRLADSPILPLYPTDYSKELAAYVNALSDHFAPHSFPVLEHALGKLEKAARKFERRRQRLEARLAELYNVQEPLPSVLSKRMAKANNRLTFFERGFLSEDGIKGREWFKHVVYAPGVWSGYVSQVFPAIVEALENKDYEQARHAENVAAQAIHQAAKNLKAKYK